VKKAIELTLITVAILSLFCFGYDFVLQRLQYKSDQNRADVFTVIVAVEHFREMTGRYPRTLDDLIKNELHIQFLKAPVADEYGYPFVYEAPIKDQGLVGTYGRDGRHGGSGFDSDFFVTFPTSKTSITNSINTLQ
jgi:hypothetical protein